MPHIDGYTRFSDDVLVKKAVAFIKAEYLNLPPSIFTQGNPLCPIDKRCCRDKGKIESGHCMDRASWLFRLGKCRKVRVDWHNGPTITEL